MTEQTKEIYSIALDDVAFYVHYKPEANMAILRRKGKFRHKVTIPSAKFHDFLHTAKLIGFNVNKL